MAEQLIASGKAAAGMIWTRGIKPVAQGLGGSMKEGAIKQAEMEAKLKAEGKELGRGGKIGKAFAKLVHASYKMRGTTLKEATAKDIEQAEREAPETEEGKTRKLERKDLSMAERIGIWQQAVKDGQYKDILEKHPEWKEEFINAGITAERDYNRRTISNTDPIEFAKRMNPQLFSTNPEEAVKQRLAKMSTEEIGRLPEEIAQSELMAKAALELGDTRKISELCYRGGDKFTSAFQSEINKYKNPKLLAADHPKVFSWLHTNAAAEAGLGLPREIAVFNRAQRAGMFRDTRLSSAQDFNINVMDAMGHPASELLRSYYAKDTLDQAKEIYKAALEGKGVTIPPKFEVEKLLEPEEMKLRAATTRLMEAMKKVEEKEKDLRDALGTSEERNAQKILDDTKKELERIRQARDTESEQIHKAEEALLKTKYKLI